MNAPGKVRFEAPAKLLPLLQKARYKAAYGGRGSGKSWFFGAQVAMRAYAAPTRIVCIREVQNSLKDSSIQLVRDGIERAGWTGHFREVNGGFETPWGSLIIFKGMQSYNAGNLKSLEDFDIAWVDEAQYLSSTSLRILRPTLRKTGSELWFSWNPRRELDAVDAFFRPTPPRNSVVVECNWSDNPWFTAELREDMVEDYARDPEMAEHVWGGGYEKITEASYYARLLLAAEKEGRIGHFELDLKSLRVRTAWDIGVDDYSAVWIIADDGYTPTVIDYWEVSGEGPDSIIPAFLPELNPDREAAWAQILELGREGYWVHEYARHHFPHDIKVREWGSGGRSRLQTISQWIRPSTIAVGVPAKPDDRIAAVRALLPRCRFLATPRVHKGLQRLRHYSRKWNTQLETFGQPLHDENSHGADAFGEYALNAGLDGLPAPVAKPALVALETPRGRIMVPHTPPKPLPQQTIDEAWAETASTRFRGV